MLDLSVPAGESQAALRAGSAMLGGETAGLYVVTRQAAARVNGEIGGVLDTLASIASSQPAAVTASSARWGPFADALSPVAWQLVVQHSEASAYAFQLEIRPKSGTDADFQPFLQGASDGVSTAGPSLGTFSVDLGIAHGLDPVGNPLDGQIVVAWNSQTLAREVHLRLTGVHAAMEPPTTADVGAVFFPDGSGALTVEADAEFVEATDGLELGRVVSLWKGTGAGRGDAELRQADGGADTSVTECWDASFDLIYFRAETVDGGTTGGDVTDCVFANPHG